MTYWPRTVPISIRRATTTLPYRGLPWRWTPKKRQAPAGLQRLFARFVFIDDGGNDRCAETERVRWKSIGFSRKKNRHNHESREKGNQDGTQVHINGGRNPASFRQRTCVGSDSPGIRVQRFRARRCRHPQVQEQHGCRE
ncbi:hypothetical protein DESC_320020 [Desulfosarcina cetonica]|nr:hypothetical protein DESC_320020 [Desulfosarcina cetonica]